MFFDQMAAWISFQTKYDNWFKLGSKVHGILITRGGSNGWKSVRNRLLTPIVSHLDLILSRWYGVWNLKSVNIPLFSWAMRLKFLLADNLPHRVDRKRGQTNSVVSELGW